MTKQFIQSEWAITLDFTAEDQSETITAKALPIVFPETMTYVSIHELDALRNLARAVGRYDNSEAKTTYRKNARTAMLQAYEDYIQVIR